MNEYKIPTNLSPGLKLLVTDGQTAYLTPLLVAIQYRHFDIARFTLEKMNIDIRQSLALSNERAFDL